jgi:uncharacterized protein (DUF885 family)
MAEAPTANAVNALADAFWEGFLERAPTYATQIGDERYDDRWDDPGPDGRERDRAATADVHGRAVAMDRHGLDVEDRITLDMLETATRIRLAEHDQHLYELAAVDQMAGAQSLPGELAAIQRVDTPERFDRLLRRLQGYPAYVDAWIDILRDALASGRMAAPSVMARTLEQVERMVATPVADSPLVARHPELPEEQATRLRDAVEAHVLPAQARFLEALRAAAPDVRQGDGIWSIPDGDAIYRTLILAQTTLDARPQELHEYGLAQIESIDRERAAIARELGHADVAALRAALDVDPSNRAGEPDDLVRLASALIERAMTAAPRWFGRLPKASCVVRAVEAFREQEAPPAFYLPPAADGSRPGTYYINTFRPEERPLYRLASTTFHEAVPGHHFQIALEGELEALVPFRRHGSRLAGIAYTEGWGLYSERLADEMALYASPHERLGMLDAQAWRAARLVVDTGIHAFRWQRQRSVEFLVRVGLSPLEANTETDRYISWPGQALSYMCGQREIQALRLQLAARDGDRFDLRGFHDAVLAHGALPLATLRHELPHWVAPLG